LSVVPSHPRIPDPHRIASSVCEGSVQLASRGHEEGRVTTGVGRLRLVDSAHGAAVVPHGDVREWCGPSGSEVCDHVDRRGGQLSDCT